jgi:undecaprenyl phosphate-alpha-L-ara4FN deformylase
MCRVGLRVDVDTLRGTRLGVPNLVELLGRHHIRASFFFSVGPDNMGRHLWRLLRPAFLAKMLRTRAASLYGWDILFRGTLWPGPVIGEKCPEPIRAAAATGHEIGLHAWDHHRWQSRVSKLDAAAMEADIRKGFDLMSRLLGTTPDCFAAPAWRMPPEALEALERFPLRYSSGCRGSSIFRPLIGDNRGTTASPRRRELRLGRGPMDEKSKGRVAAADKVERSGHPQVPVTLPTYDETIGPNCPPEAWNDHLLGMIQPDRLNVLTIHAEAEGISCLGLFEEFLLKASSRGITFEALGDLLSRAGKVPDGAMGKAVIAGRVGWVSVQEGKEARGYGL